MKYTPTKEEKEEFKKWIEKLDREDEEKCNNWIKSNGFKNERK